MAAVHHYVWIGLVLALALLVVHLKWSDDIKHELKLIIIVAVMGVSVESVLCYHGLLDFVGHNPWYPISPPWMWGIWLVFAATLNSSLAFFQRHLWIAASCGAVDLPISYLIGQKLGAVHLHPVITVLAILSAVWGVLLPVAAFIARPRG